MKYRLYCLRCWSSNIERNVVIGRGGSKDVEYVCKNCNNIWWEYEE